METTVRIGWSREFDNNLMWNEVCAWAIERFGLPGERFRTSVNVNYMEFIFNSKHDALIMALQWNAPIVTNEQIAVESMSRAISG